MLRRCLLTPAPRRAPLIAALPFCDGCRRSYATDRPHQGTRSSAKERRYYTEPLRAPQSGVRTVVGRFAHPSGVTAPPASAGVSRSSGPHAGVTNTAVNTTARCLTTRLNPKTQLMKVLAAHGRTVRYDSAGVPVEGSWYLLPWHEQMRILAAVISALCITKAFFDGVRFELLYYGVWKLGYRNNDSLMKRVLYYGSTALLAAGLFFSFNLNFFLSAWLVGRRQMAAHMMSRGFSHLLPQRVMQLMERRMKFSLV
ncbi:hypothetical protein ABB37_02500 [Leptomonas pyrrhocoris]|uniref:Uncharacterized protein n=1 Tax=Leptomonas pyrrhocoris TaxID=157538 RepID=A0A0N0DX89_LEPPY|nr:hypothetical protein ABB37_02500 [Leptomonas pyrrhocoris]KPA82671.1 hypothetical protein ABB37_02500 [Leptomonas pyrrhocoris]|eukprot:XP_015661110.1 hypothetical protein ABB37_02500 [Leptomonas pyrrhocoris]